MHPTDHGPIEILDPDASAVLQMSTDGGSDEDEFTIRFPAFRSIQVGRGRGSQRRGRDRAICHPETGRFPMRSSEDETGRDRPQPIPSRWIMLEGRSRLMMVGIRRDRTDPGGPS